MTFPDKKFDRIDPFFDAYAAQVTAALASVPRSDVAKAQHLVECAITDGRPIYVCGNGGSAAISNHLVRDHAKGISTDTGLRPRIQSLSANVELLSAIANDIAYAQVFAAQLTLFARPGELLIAISASGNSDNVVEAIRTANSLRMRVIALTGFDGGRCRELAEVCVHVKSDNYGVVEDVHQSVMHVLAQFTRMEHMPADLVSSRKF
jgi:phosphoheptose isomerase